MAERSRRQKHESRPLPSPGRFDATIHPGRDRKDLRELDAEPLDRMPDRYGRVRALLTGEEIADFVERGYEVRLHRHHRIQPLPRDLLVTDRAVERWIEDSLGKLREDQPETKSRRTKKG